MGVQDDVAVAGMELAVERFGEGDDGEVFDAPDEEAWCEAHVAVVPGWLGFGRGVLDFVIEVRAD